MALGFYLDTSKLFDAGLFFDGDYPSPGTGEYTGEYLYLVFDTIAISANYRKFTISQNIGLKDGSAGADNGRLYVSELQGGNASYEGLYQTEDAAISGVELLSKTEPGDVGRLTWAPQGPTSGTPIYYVDAIVKDRKIEIIYEDVVKISINFEFNGDITDTVVI